MFARSLSLAAAVKVAATPSLSRVAKKPTKTLMTVTPAAIQQLKNIIQNKPNTYGVKIGVKKRGCSGLSYTLDFADKKDPFDEEIKAGDINVLIDSKALFSLIGTEMDYISDRIKSEFIFHNPNVKSTCGCGESFNVADSTSQSLMPTTPSDAETLSKSSCSTTNTNTNASVNSSSNNNNNNNNNRNNSNL